MNKAIRLLVMDVDGTLTDGKIYMGNAGEVMKAFSVKDGLRIKQLRMWGIEPVIITGRQSDIVSNRARELDIVEVHQGIDDKVIKLKDVCRKWNCKLDEVAYIGDDVNDLECMKMCGNSGCTADAVDEVRGTVNYVCKNKGGEGAVREYIEYLLKEKRY